MQIKSIVLGIAVSLTAFVSAAPFYRRCYQDGCGHYSYGHLHGINDPEYYDGDYDFAHRHDHHGHHNYHHLFFDPHHIPYDGVARNLDGISHVLDVIGHDFS